MDLEKTEEMLEDARLVTEGLGMLSMEHFAEDTHNTVMGFEMFGSAFFRALGAALKVASIKDAVKIINMWRSECQYYAILYDSYRAKKEAEEALG